MDDYRMHRVVDKPGDEWDGDRLAIIDKITGKWAEMEWVPEDKQVRIDFFNADGDFQESDYSFLDENPLIEMFSNSPNANPDILYEDNPEVDIEWGIW